jgi:hypothetical protein
MAYDIIVVNKYKDQIPDAYHTVDIMRPSILGNPFPLANEEDREQVLAQFKQYLWQQMNIPDSPIARRLRQLSDSIGDMALVCCCKPKSCHGDIIKDAILWLRKINHHQ